MTVIFNAILCLCCLCSPLGPEQHWDPPGCDVCWYFGLQKQGSDQLFPMVSVLNTLTHYINNTSCISVRAPLPVKTIKRPENMKSKLVFMIRTLGNEHNDKVWVTQIMFATCCIVILSRSVAKVEIPVICCQICRLCRQSSWIIPALLAVFLAAVCGCRTGFSLILLISFSPICCQLYLSCFQKSIFWGRAIPFDISTTSQILIMT